MAATGKWLISSMFSLLPKTIGESPILDSSRTGSGGGTADLFAYHFQQQNQMRHNHQAINGKLYHQQSHLLIVRRKQRAVLGCIPVYSNVPSHTKIQFNLSNLEKKTATFKTFLRNTTILLECQIIQQFADIALMGITGWKSLNAQKLYKSGISSAMLPIAKVKSHYCL